MSHPGEGVAMSNENRPHRRYNHSGHRIRCPFEAEGERAALGASP